MIYLYCIFSGRNVLFFDGKDVEYDRNFRFYMTSKMSNPHYLPETCIKVNLINFTVTPHGLEDQLLADVVLKEEPELEERKNKIILKMAEDKRELKETEDRILDGLSNNSGEILDNQELIEVLRQAKRKSEQIAKKVEESAETEIQISAFDVLSSLVFLLLCPRRFFSMLVAMR